jgi:hypothetical protein
MVGGGCSPHGDGEDVFADEEEVMATRISNGGELGRRTDGGRQGAALSGTRSGFVVQERHE